MEKYPVGGQAVIEGVMMKSPNFISTAVRTPKGKIVVKDEPFLSYTKRSKVLGLPFVRGTVSLVEMLVVGMKSLSYSADIATDDEKEEPKGPKDIHKDDQFSGWYMAISLLFGLGLALFLFKFLPLTIAQFINNTLGTGNSIIFSAIDGLSRIMIFILYIVVISQWNDIKVVFQYHGAEHKAVNCYEAGKSLTVSNVKKYSTIHRRCGTCFILIVLLLSIIVYSFIPNSTSFVWKLLLRLLLLPVIAGISYEILKLGAKNPGNILLRIATAPGLWFQKLTTREPSAKQIEVAIKALESVLKKESRSRS